MSGLPQLQATGAATTAALRRRSVPHLSRMPASGRLGLAGLVILTLVALLGPLVVHAPRTDTAAIIQAPSAAHVLGTDFSGRDNLALVVHGAREMLLLAAVAGLVMVVIATAVGLSAALSGGLLDTALVQVTDLWLTVPRFILLIVVASLVRIDNTVVFAVLIAVFGWPALARQVRSQALSLRRREFVEAARLLDLGFAHILLRQVLPVMAPFVVIAAIQGMTQAIYQQVGLAFLGVVPLTDNWGVLFSVAYGQNALYLPAASWSLTAPILAICLLQISLVLTSRGLEEAFNPRLRGPA